MCWQSTGRRPSYLRDVPWGRQILVEPHVFYRNLQRWQDKKVRAQGLWRLRGEAGGEAGAHLQVGQPCPGQ